ncbi:3'(2'),5'-bisphosphate nucleotidase [Candidatus Magnetoovum chiemensis]|nr:3'(2'),5'-bisphosphate nucleotidase [Candidatus Magnetoovum chiemensis]
MLHESLLKAIKAARLAGCEILEVYNKNIEIEYKDDRSPITLADKNANKAITNALSRTELNGEKIPILSEEGKTQPFDNRKNWNCFWLIDPLDGTKEFIKRNGEFTVNIALIHKNHPAAAVIYIPVEDTFYFSADNIGAYRLRNSRIIDDIIADKNNLDNTGYNELLSRIIAKSEKLPSASLPDKPTILLGSRSHISNEFGQFMNKLKETSEDIEIKSFGSSIKFCKIAEGEAHIYARLGKTMEWDTAAGHHIVEQTGGKVLNAETKTPLIYNKENLLNPFFIVIRQGLDDKTILKACDGIYDSD